MLDKPSSIPNSKELTAIINKEFSRTRVCSAFEFTKKILKYDSNKTIGGKEEKVLQKDSFKSNNKHSPAYWIGEVKTLYNPSMVLEIGIPEFILGMTIIDENLKNSFNPNYLTDLRDRVLKKYRTKDLDAVFRGPGDDTDVHRDAATSVDELERESFAMAIAQRLNL